MTWASVIEDDMGLEDIEEEAEEVHPLALQHTQEDNFCRDFTPEGLTSRYDA